MHPQYWVLCGFLAVATALLCHFTHNNADTAPLEPVIRHVQYSLTIRNTTSRMVRDASLWIWIPATQPGRQRITHMETLSNPLHLEAPNGNRMLQWQMLPIPPYATQVVPLHISVEMAAPISPAPPIDPAPYLTPALYIESDDPGIREQAARLGSKNHLETARAIFKWVANHIQYDGYVRLSRGARYAFAHQKGDCTEYMYLFAALCRAAGIPARCIGGYKSCVDTILKPTDYHNWAEFRHNGQWHIADPQQQAFMPPITDYLIMRIIDPSPNDSAWDFDRFRLEGNGLEATMTS